MDQVGRLSIVRRSIEDIFSPTMSIFGARWAPLVLSIVIVASAFFFVFIVPWFVVVGLAEGGHGVAAGIVALVMALAGFFSTGYVSVGLARVTMAVARNDPSPLVQLRPPLKPVIRFLVVTGLMYLLLLIWSVASVVALDAAPRLGLLFVLSMVFIGIPLGFVIQWLMWSWIFVVSDGKTSTIDSIRAAYRIGMHNKMTSFLLMMITAVLSMAGMSACYVGQIVTIPITMLMYGVAYLMITNQPIHHPKPAGHMYPPPPNQPTF